jgi:hypothetical protein
MVCKKNQVGSPHTISFFCVGSGVGSGFCNVGSGGRINNLKFIGIPILLSFIVRRVDLPNIILYIIAKYYQALQFKMC